MGSKDTKVSSSEAGMYLLHAAEGGWMMKEGRGVCSRNEMVGKKNSSAIAIGVFRIRPFCSYTNTIDLRSKLFGSLFDRVNNNLRLLRRCSVWRPSPARERRWPSAQPEGHHEVPTSPMFRVTGPVLMPTRQPLWPSARRAEMSRRRRRRCGGRARDRLQKRSTASTGWWWWWWWWWWW